MCGSASHKDTKCHLTFYDASRMRLSHWPFSMKVTFNAQPCWLQPNSSKQIFQSPETLSRVLL